MFQVLAGEDGIARKHLDGVLAIIHFSGGPQSLGLTGLLERMCHRFLTVLSLTDTRLEQLDTS